MSKKAKAAAKIKRLSFKRARKSAQTAQYQTWAAQGTNQRSKRSKIASKRVSNLTTQKHAMTRCDNIGCSRSSCHRELYALPNSSSYGTRFSRSDAPWFTSKKKLSHALKLQEQERTQAKANRQARNAHAAAKAAELAEKVAKSEVLWAEWARERQAARAEAKAKFEAEQAEELAQTVSQET